MAKKRVVAEVRGVVQGVYFRDYTQQEGRHLGLSGWVRNRPDGSVEAVLEGEAEKVDAMVSWLHTGSPMAKVESVQVSEEQPQGDTSTFAIRYG
ncbi:MAG: acylphosphatase [Thermodesulfobacteriota bacterium]